jgi:hypothetical protein
MNIIPFDGNKALPDYFQAFDLSALNSAFVTASSGFPVLSLKDKHFTVIKGGVGTMLMNPKDPESPAMSIDVVIIATNKGYAKAFYAKAYDPNSSEKQKPDCYSNDGVAPAADAKAPQAKNCSVCPHNQFGSRTGGDGSAGKGKACSDAKRLAVAAAGQINDPMLLRVPPASLKGLSDYASFLGKRNAAIPAVVTKISFDPTSAKLVFKAVGLLDQQSFAEVLEIGQTELVQDIIGGNMSAVYEDLAEADVAQTAPKVEAQPEPKVEPPAPAKPPKAKPKVQVVEDDLEIDGLSFDD